MTDAQAAYQMPRIMATRLLSQALQSPTLEICGLVGAQEGMPSSIYPVRNISSDPAQRFEMDPQEQIQAFQRMREQNEDLFAIYHSHPTGAANPSLYDQNDIGYPEALYLIISLGIKGVMEMTAWQMQQGKLAAVELQVFES